MSQVFRGGSFWSNQRRVRCVHRAPGPPNYQVDGLSFRVAKRRGYFPTVRGSSFDYDYWFAKCALRFWGRPEARRILRGFRVSRRKP